MSYKIYDGIVSSGIVLDQDSMDIYSGGVANDTSVSSGGWMNIYSGGVASNTTVNSGGDMTICSGGVANNTTVEDCGRMYIESGGVVNDTTINDGDMYISSGGVASNTTVNYWGSLDIENGGSALNVNWTPCIGDVYIADGAVVTFTSKYSGVYFGLDGQLLSQTTVMNGKNISDDYCMYVMSGGVASNTTVNYFGEMDIWSGGVASNTTVNAGGMYISSGGVHRGKLTIDGGVVFASSGAIIDFTVKDRKTEDDYLINNLSEVRGGIIRSRSLRIRQPEPINLLKVQAVSKARFLSAQSLKHTVKSR